MAITFARPAGLRRGQTPADLADPPATDLVLVPEILSTPPAGPLHQTLRAQRHIQKVERDLGGRELIIAELLTAPALAPAVRSLLEFLYDPRFDQQPLGVLCDRAGLSPGQVFDAFRDATMSKAHLHAIRLVAAKIPVIIADLLTASVDHEEVCPICDGAKIMLAPKSKKALAADPDADPYEDRPCRRCRQTGQIKVKGDPDQQKIALELIGLLKKPTGIQITNTNQTVNQSASITASEAGASLFDLQKAVAAVVHRRSIILRETDQAGAPSADPTSTPLSPVVDATLVESA